MDKRQQEIHAKRFDMFNSQNDNDPTQFGKIKVGVKTLDDAILDLGSYKDIGYNPYGVRGFSKEDVMQAIANKDYPAIRIISDFFYRTDGIYRQLVDMDATFYR